MRRIKLLFLLILFPAVVFSQDQENQAGNSIKSIQIEMGGLSFPYSVNYEKVFDLSQPLKTVFKAGIGVFPKLDCWYSCKLNTIETQEELGYLINIEWLKLTGSNKGHFEFGLGYTYNKMFNENINHLGSLRLGYRWMDLSLTKKFYFRAGINVMIRVIGVNPGASQRLFSSPGIGIGYSFP